MIKVLLLCLLSQAANAQLFRQGVNSIAVSTNTPLKGAVTFTAGSNITLTQAPQGITIAASGATGLRTIMFSWGQSSAQTGCSSSTCPFLTQQDSSGNTDTVSSISRSGTGVYAVNITSGRCSAAPSCNFILYTDCKASAQTVYISGSPSTSTVPFTTDAASVTNGCGWGVCACAP